jgi:NAD+--asparagine ADP-ribosyltransferase
MGFNRYNNPYTEMKTKEEILKHHLRHISFEASDKTFINVCQAMEEYAQQQLSDKDKEIAELKKTITRDYPQSCPKCKSSDVIMFTSDLDLCQRCGQTF